VEGGSCNDYEYVCGDPVNGFDLNGTKGYSYSFDLGWCMCTAEDLWRDFLSDPDAFPFSVEGVAGSLGPDDVGLTAHLPRFTYRAPVEVVDISSVSLTFRSLPGHPEGAGNHITFQIEATRSEHRWSRLRLNVEAWGPYNGGAGRFGFISRGYAYWTWYKFARNLRGMVRSY
jgi:hypothetical protein